MAITKWTISTQEKNAPLRAWARLFLSKERPEHAGAEALIVGCCAHAASGHAAAPPGRKFPCGELPAPMERRRELLLVGRGQEPAPVVGCGRRLMRCCAVRSRVRTALLPLPFLSHQGHQTLR